MPNVQRPIKPPLRFRTRLFAILFLFAIIPAGILTLLGGLTLSSTLPLITGPARWDSVAATGQQAMSVAAELPLSDSQRIAFEAHEAELRASLEQSQRLNYLLDRGTKVIVIGSFLALALIIFVASRVAGHLSRQLSRPIDELVEWTDLIRRGEELPNLTARPENPKRRGAPEFETLRQRMRVAAVALDIGRQRAMEAERLRAFRESARQVAHELKNPLTPIRFALARIKRDLPASLKDAVEVMETETARLERTANSFAQFGKLPEGPPAPIDIAELLKYVTSASIPDTMNLNLRLDQGMPMIMGYHDALAGALTNVILNAVDACGGSGTITVTAFKALTTDNQTKSGIESNVVRIIVADTGPGIPADALARIWDPYVTQKPGGTGLGLTIARQVVWAHEGTVTASSVPGEGTQIQFELPVTS